MHPEVKHKKVKDPNGKRKMVFGALQTETEESFVDPVKKRMEELDLSIEESVEQDKKQTKVNGKVIKPVRQYERPVE